MSTRILYVPTYECDRGCSHCSDDSCSGGAQFEKEELQYGAMRNLFEYGNHHRGEFVHVGISGGGESLMSAYVPYIADVSLCLCGNVGLITSGPANEIEEKRYSAVQQTFENASSGLLLGGSEMEYRTSEPIYGYTCVSWYDNFASHKRVTRALQLAQSNVAIRMVYSPKGRMLDIVRRLSWINSLLYSEGFFFVGFYQRNSHRPRATNQEILSGKLTELNWLRPTGQELAHEMFKWNVVPLYAHPRKWFWTTVERMPIQCYGRATFWLKREKLYGCGCLTGDCDYIAVTPSGLKYCAVSETAYSFDDIDKVIAQRDAIKKAALRGLIQRIKPDTRSLCDVCPLRY